MSEVMELKKKKYLKEKRKQEVLVSIKLFKVSS